MNDETGDQRGSAKGRRSGGEPSADVAGAGDIERIRAAARRGDPQAMYLLGVACAQGRHLPQDDAEAAVWFGRAAARDHVQAKVSLGYCCATGRGVRRDLAKAYMLLREAADAGDRKGFELAEKVACRLHGEVLRRCERELRRRRALRAAGRRPPPAPKPAAREPMRRAPVEPPPEEGEIIEIDVPDA